jgi:UDP-galactopyranose mutase
VFYTGPIDRYFARLALPPLEYRTVTFNRSVQATAAADGFVQPASQVNFPDAATPHTRITEYKHLPNQDTASGRLHVPSTVLMTEFSSGEGEPFYPVPAPANRDLYERYRAAAAAERGVVFVGRLASYKYFNMDQAILAALETADTFLARSPA